MTGQSKSQKDRDAGVTSVTPASREPDAPRSDVAGPDDDVDSGVGVLVAVEAAMDVHEAARRVAPIFARMYEEQKERERQAQVEPGSSEAAS